MLTRLYLAVIGWLGHRLGRAAAKSAMAPQSLRTLNPDLLRQMPPRTRKRWRIFRCLPLLLLAGCDPLPGWGHGFYGAGAFVAGLLTVGYCRLRWGGGVLRVRGQEVLHVGDGLLGAVCGRNRWIRWRSEIWHGHRTLPGAIWAALGLRFPLVVHWGTYPGRIEIVKWRYGTQSSWRHGTAYLRWFKVIWALLLLLSSPALACDGIGPCGAYAQTAAQELAPVSAPNHGSWEPVTAGLNRQDREMVAPPTCEESLQDCRRLAVELHQEQPARWPWALAGLLVGALLGAWGLLRSGRSKVVLMQRLGVHDFEWYVHRAAGRWWVTDDSQEVTHYFRFWWQALRDAWRLSREVR